MLMDVANKILSEKSTIQASEADLSTGDKRTTWYDSGQIKSEANFINDKEEGKSTWWHDNGQIKKVAYYENGVRVK